MAIKIRNADRWTSLTIFLVILVLWMLQTKTTHESWSESTRLAVVQSLVEHGTWRIDASPYGHETGDKMLLDGHYYSDKPPLFPAIGAAFYSSMYYGLGVKLAIDGCRSGLLCVYYWLTVLMVGIPSAIMAVLFYRLGLQQIGSVGWAVGLTILLCFGTVVWPYSLVFNHHLPAAIALFISFYLLLNHNQSHYRLFLAGLLVGGAVMFDLTSVFLAFALFLIVIVYNRKSILIFVGAALIPVVATVIFNYQITGGPLFAYFSPEGYQYPGSPWDATVAGQHSPDNVVLYTFRSLVGDYGIFGYSPLLIFAVFGLVCAFGNKDHHLTIGLTPLKNALILLGLLGHLIFVLTQTDNFGGDAYGWRFLIPIIPTLYIYIIFVVPAYFNKPGGGWVAVLWGIAVVVSLFSAYQGVRATWHQIHPPFFMALHHNFPYLTIETNLNLPDQTPVVYDNKIPVRTFEVPIITHPLDVNLNHELRLLGYDLSTRRVKPGQNLELTLYWQLVRVVQGDYFVFTHLLNANQTRLGSLDRRLQEGYPVTFWYPGEIVSDHRQLLVEPDATQGLAWLRVGGYELTADQQVKPLPLYLSDTETPETSLALESILVGTSPQAVDSNNFAPERPLAIELGEPQVILLRGYDWTKDQQTLKLTLYWESLAPTDVDWTTFVHLRNENKEIIAQKDGQTGGGSFPTSLWNVEEIIAEPVLLPLPSHLEEGKYTVVGGVYRLDTGQRLAVPTSDDNSFNLMTIELGVDER